MSAERTTPISLHDPRLRELEIANGYARLFRAAEDVRESRLLLHVDDAHLEHSLDELEKRLSELEALL